MKIKYYHGSKEYVLKFLYSLDHSEQMAINYTFGNKAQLSGITVENYICELIKEGRFTYKGIHVKFQE
jgi:hypothetical protein